MQDQPKEQLKVPEKKQTFEERAQEFAKFKEGRKAEEKEVTEQDKMVAMELRREIEIMEIDENLRKEASEKAQKIKFLGDDKKLEHLLAIAKEKGIVAAIHAAKEMNDPFILDALHDLLAQEGYYKNFAK